MRPAPEHESRHLPEIMVNTPKHKLVSKSKVSEWRGLDRISSVVHEMRCIWREQEKDDIGIDGEIELCRQRQDGDGMIGTGKIIKVQSKSGSSYVVRDSDQAFASPVEEKDLHYWRGLNVPAIYVVYHPDDDRLYWKHVQSYIAERPEALKPPFRIEFSKTSDQLDAGAYNALVHLCELAPDRVLTDRGETLFSNILPVLSLPPAIFVASVLPEKRTNFHDRIRGSQWIPPYQYGSGSVATLTDPTEGDSALRDVIDHACVESFSLADWLSQDRSNEARLNGLLNSTLHRHLRGLGLEFSKDHRRYFFNKGLAEDSPLKRTWRSSRTHKAQPRLVAKHYEYGRNRFYRHLAVDARFNRFGDHWGIVIEPKVHFSTDGTTRWEGRTARSYAIKARIEEWNNIFLNNVLFWADQFSRGEPTFDLMVDGQTICTVGGTPLSTETTFSIEAIAVPDRRVPRK
ncbi:DUF4365 domain-containing protein [Bradyrhizobium yuanmingense]|uniref:DUF4365 domain-containing protein n=1 Tax=Bradyrhizobium yuanmingense TaxID=108015 RepID=UPI00351937AF